MSNELPAGMREWVALVGGGTITRLDRAVARREAYFTEVTRPDGSVLKGFLRLDRNADPKAPSALKKEIGIVQALNGSNVPVSKVHGVNDALNCVLFDHIPGRADLQNMERPQQHAVMRDFMEVIARMHTLDLSKLSLPPMKMPANAYECALDEMDITLAHMAGFVASYRDPLMSYGIDWLRRFAPKHVERISLLQGDTGPVNFMFDGDHVTALFDFELGHLGDPMEDLGNICVREFWNPSGGLDGLMQLYEQKSGIKVDLDAVRYYRVQQQMRGMVGIHYATTSGDPHEPLAWYLAYRYVGDRATCEGIAQSLGVTVSPPEFPAEDPKRDPLALAASWALKHDIEPAVNNPLAASRARDVDVMVRCMERVARYGAEIDAIECREMAALLGVSVNSIADGYEKMDDAIKDHRIPDAPMIQYLARRAYRAEWLYQPCADLCPDRQWSPLN
jgi:aminoglycoside phosphotransferase (APT) family kinase protein